MRENLFDGKTNTVAKDIPVIMDLDGVLVEADDINTDWFVVVRVNPDIESVVLRKSLFVDMPVQEELVGGFHKVVTQLAATVKQGFVNARDFLSVKDELHHIVIVVTYDNSWVVNTKVLDVVFIVSLQQEHLLEVKFLQNGQITKITKMEHNVV